MQAHPIIPADFPVQPVTGLAEPETVRGITTCGACGLSWDDAIITSMTPAPSARCPFEAFHDEINAALAADHADAYPEEDEEDVIDAEDLSARLIAALEELSYVDAEDLARLEDDYPEVAHLARLVTEGRVESFADGMVLTSNAGFTVDAADGSAFQVQIVEA